MLKSEFAKTPKDRLKVTAKTAIYPMLECDRTKGRSPNTKPHAPQPKIHSIPTATSGEIQQPAAANQTTNSTLQSAPAKLEPPATATSRLVFT